MSCEKKKKQVLQIVNGQTIIVYKQVQNSEATEFQLWPQLWRSEEIKSSFVESYFLKEDNVIFFDDVKEDSVIPS